MGNKVLYKTIGRTVMPVASVDADDKNGDAVLSAVKQAHLIEAIKSGAQTPTFEVVTTRVEGDVSNVVSREVF